MRFIVPLFAVLSLAGCKHIEEAENAADDRKCASYGVAKGSDAYVQCRMALERNRSNEIAAASGGARATIPLR